MNDPPLPNAYRVAELLAEQPYRFDFFQAVRLLTGQALREASLSAGRREVGSDADPRQEVVRFRVTPSHSFPPGAIRSVQRASTQAGRPAAPPEMQVAFLGLIGPSGVLPRHYTQMVIDRVRARDYALRDFLDMFHHRAISHFYQVWAKYHFPTQFESAALRTGQPGADPVSQGLFALIGMGTACLRDRLSCPDEELIYYGGLLAHFPRSAVGLEGLLADRFALDVRIEQFQGQWLCLERSDQTRLATPRHGLGGNNRLGVDAIAGERVWGVESKIRVRLGPLSWSQFLDFTPSGPLLPLLAQLVRLYVGSDLDFDVQPVLKKDDVPACQAGADRPARLGWTSWVRSRPARADAEDAVFRMEGNPAR